MQKNNKQVTRPLYHSDDKYAFFKKRTCNHCNHTYHQLCFLCEYAVHIRFSFPDPPIKCPHHFSVWNIDISICLICQCPVEKTIIVLDKVSPSYPFYHPRCLKWKPYKALTRMPAKIQSIPITWFLSRLFPNTQNSWPEVWLLIERIEREIRNWESEFWSNQLCNK